MDLFGGGKKKSAPDPLADLAKTLVDVDINRMTPVQALNALDKLSREARRLVKEGEGKKAKR